jgi:hypothetical protein
VSVYRDQIGELLRVVEVVSPTTHSWFGVPTSRLPAETTAAMAPEAARAFLLYTLQSQLYADFYCSGGARLPVDGGLQSQPGTHTPFLEQLSLSNSGSGSLDPGWRVVDIDDGLLVVDRGAGLRFWATADELQTADGAAASVASTVSVRMPKELLRLSPGFYMGLGDAELAFDESTPLVRLYWNLRASAAPTLVAKLTSTLNRQRIAFRLKVVSDIEAYERCDAGVLYVPRSTFSDVAPVAAATYAEIAAGLDPPVPALTKRLAPGLGLAEDPPGGVASFGMSRCAVLAEGIIRAADREAKGDHQRLAVIAECFAEAGLDIDAPYLEQGSSDVYAVTGL